jgi:hypothetical protein
MPGLPGVFKFRPEGLSSDWIGDLATLLMLGLLFLGRFGYLPW